MYKVIFALLAFILSPFVGYALGDTYGFVGALLAIPVGGFLGAGGIAVGYYFDGGW